MTSARVRGREEVNLSGPGSNSEASVVSDDDENLIQILEVFPGIKQSYAKERLEANNNNLEQVLVALVDLNGVYPREERKKKVSTKNNEMIELAVDFMSPHAFAGPPSQRYRCQATALLLQDFPFLGKRKIRMILESNSHRYAIAHDHICQKIVTQIESVHSNRRGDELLFGILFEQNIIETEDVALLTSIFSLKASKSIFKTFPFRRKQCCPRVTSTQLAMEIPYVQDKLRKLKATLQADIDRRRNKKNSITTGTFMTCDCCYDDVDMEEIVACRDEGHLFCRDCLSNYVETQIFANGGFGVNPETKERSLEILCFHGDGCTSSFDRYHLKKALKPKVLEKYDELQFQASIEKAGLSANMFSCPRCELMFEIPPTSNFFKCPMEDCGHEACRHCRGAPHLGSKCEERHETLGRAGVEEAATAAVVRCCPKCKRGVIKSEGCNRIKCSCGCSFCYICEKMVFSYSSHFCQKPHCNHKKPEETCQNKCPLYTDDDAIDHQARTNAVIAAAANIRDDIEIDVHSILKLPPSAQTLRTNRTTRRQAQW